jgi:hypothetical protein
MSPAIMKAASLQEEGFVGEAGEGHADAFAGEIEFFAGDGGGLLFQFGRARGEGGFLAVEARRGCR